MKLIEVINEIQKVNLSDALNGLFQNDTVMLRDILGRIQRGQGEQGMIQDFGFDSWEQYDSEQLESTPNSMYVRIIFSSLSSSDFLIVSAESNYFKSLDISKWKYATSLFNGDDDDHPDIVFHNQPYFTKDS
jgi:hypothetical protein